MSRRWQLRLGLGLGLWLSLTLTLTYYIVAGSYPLDIVRFCESEKDGLRFWKTESGKKTEKKRKFQKKN